MILNRFLSSPDDILLNSTVTYKQYRDYGISLLVLVSKESSLYTQTKKNDPMFLSNKITALSFRE